MRRMKIVFTIKARYGNRIQRSCLHKTKKTDQILILADSSEWFKARFTISKSVIVSANQ